MHIDDNCVLLSEGQNILRSLLGRKIVGGVRCSSWQPEEIQKYRKISPDDVFSLMSGSLLLELEGVGIVGLSNHPPSNSSCLWLGAPVFWMELSGSILDGKTSSIFTISMSDNRYSSAFFKALIGKRIDAVSILKRKATHPRELNLPNEIGLCIVMESGEKIAVGHGIYDATDDFLVVPWEIVDSKYLTEIQYMPVLW